jgi:site-specific DNA-methyltransferase (adenine-specific)
MIKPYWESEHGKIYNCDCLDVLPELEPVDLVLTDPPYGVKRDKGFEGFGGFGIPIARRRYENDNWDSERPSKEIFDIILKKSTVCMFFGGNFFADLLPKSTHWIVWDKKNTMPDFGDAELIWTNCNRKSVKIIVREYNGLIGKEEKRYHPTQKPIGLFMQILQKYAKPGWTILDCFAGSGTTALACERIKAHRAGNPAIEAV